MQIDALYENGIIKPHVPLHFKKDRVKVKIIIPDDSLVKQSPLKRSRLREKIDNILGSYSRSRPDKTPEQDKIDWHEHLMEKYGK
jgi:predicted DNA-binding antitoxin AbrB/MazE fold protein